MELTENDLPEIQSELEEVDNWHKLGLQLEVPAGKLTEFERNYTDDAQHCKAEVLTWWLQNATDCSWNTLAQAIEAMGGHQAVAEKLRMRQAHEESVVGTLIEEHTETTEQPTTDRRVQPDGHPSDITRLEQGTDQYNAATDLIGSGVDFDSCSAGRARTILELRKLEHQYSRYKKNLWATSARLDNQGDFTRDGQRYAKLVIQIGNCTHAQANVQIGFNFGKRGIRHALNQSLKNAKVMRLKDFIAKAQIDDGT